jgi:hypothetical protein
LIETDSEPDNTDIFVEKKDYFSDDNKDNFHEYYLSDDEISDPSIDKPP